MIVNPARITAPRHLLFSIERCKGAVWSGRKAEFKSRVQMSEALKSCCATLYDREHRRHRFGSASLLTASWSLAMNVS